MQDASDSIFANPLAVCAAVFGAVVSDLVPASAAEILYNGIGFEDVRTVPFGGISLAQTPTAGTHSFIGGSLPSDVCLAIKKSTGNIGRSGRGRWYFPLGNTAALVTPDTTSAAVATGFTTALTNFQAAVEATAGTPLFGIVSYRTGGAPRAAGLFQRVTGWSVSDLFIDSQRRRLLGRGR